MNVFSTILIEFLFVSSCILFLFRYRSQLGLAPLYIYLGAIQYLQVFSSSYISFEFLETYTIYPVSVIIFSSVLFAVLLIYIKEGVASARTLILGIIISNFLLTALAGITFVQESVLGMIAEDLPKSGFNTGYKYFIIGTIILLFDFILLVILYQFFITKIKKLSYFIVLFVSLLLVLFFDSIVFNAILKYSSPDLLNSLIGHFISKSVAAFIFSFILYLYLKYIDKEQTEISFIANQSRDVLSILTYRKKYLNLKIEKEQVEKVLTSKLESTLDNSSDGFVSLDTNWCYTYVNNKAGEFLGRDAKSLIGKHIWTEFPEGVNQPFYKAYYKAVETQQTQVLQEFYEPLDRWFENRIYPSSDGLTIYFTDITDQKKADLALKESENHIRTILETEPECIKQINKKGELIYMNPAGLAMIEADTLEMVKGNSVINLINPKDQEAFKKLTSDVFKGKSGHLVFEITGIKGTNRWLETHAVPLRNTDGNIISLLGVTREITNRKKIEEELIENENLFRRLTTYAPVGIFQTDKEGSCNFVNDEWQKYAGMTFEDAMGFGWVNSIHPEDKERVLNIWQESILNNTEFLVEFKFQNQNNQVTWASAKAVGLYDSQNDLYGYIGMVLDITERKNAEDRVLKSERYLENIINNIGDPVFVKDDKSHFLLANEAFYKFFNRTKEEIIGKVFAEDVPVEERERYLTVDNQVISTGKESIYEDEVVIKGGETKFISTKKTRFIDDDGNKYLIGVLRDITERKQAELKINKSEKSLTEAQKIAKIGSFNLDLKSQVAQASKSFNEIIEVDDNFELTFDIWKTIVFPGDRSRIKETVNECEKNRQKFDLEYRIIPKNKDKIKWIHGLGEFYFINGEATNFIGTIQDITERKEVEIQLKAATEFSDKLIMSMQEGLIIINLEGEILLVNDSTCKILGYSQKELVGLNLPYPFAKIEDLEDIEKTKEKVINGETLFQFEFIKKSGEKFLASFSTGIIKNDNGEVIAMFATMKDVSEEEKAKERLEANAKKSKLRKDAIVKLASFVGQDFDKTLNKVTALAAKTLDVERVSVWQLNEDQTENYCKNLYNLKTDSYSNGLILKKADHPKYFKQLEEKGMVSVNDAVSNVLTKSMVKDYLIPNNITTKISIAINGRDRLYGIICFEHVGDNRIWDYDEEEFAISISNIVSLMIESTERKLAESELKAQKEFSEELITSLNEGLSVIDLKGRHIKVNQALCKMTGFSEEELLGRDAPFPYWPPEEKDDIIKAFNDPLNNLGVTRKWTFMRKNGERFPVSLTSSTIKNHDGEIIAYFSTIIDITDSLKAENFLKEVAVKSTEKKNVIMKLSGLVGTDYHNSLEQITTLSAGILNVQRAGIWKFNEDRSAIICEMLYDSKSSEFENGVILSRVDNPNYFDALAENKTISVEDAVNNDITKGFANDYLIPVGITSMLDVFIQGEKEVYGVICFEHIGLQKKWTADDEEFALSIANVVSLMVESTERKLAEENLISSNEALLVANTELEKLRSQLVDENVYLRNEIDLVFNYEEMVYGSEVFSAVLTEVEKVATTNATVLLLGESGTGKELLARAIQNIGNRKHKPLIKVNCAAIPRELIESELFGHVKGSFTGAINDKVGKFELADGGTLFLDEIGELPLDMQPKLLRFLQEGEIEKVGDTRTLKVDVRIIAATNKDLKKEVEKKLFREDLYFRLNVFPIMVPPLRERMEDIPLLVEHFADKFSKAYGKEVTYITDGAMLAMKRYNWPGNIRELENVIERGVILSTNNFLVLPDFDTKLQAKERLISASDLTLDDVQREHIIKTLDKCNWKIDGANGASSILNIKPSTLRDRMKKLGVVKPL